MTTVAVVRRVLERHGIDIANIEANPQCRGEVVVWADGVGTGIFSARDAKAYAEELIEDGWPVGNPS